MAYKKRTSREQRTCEQRPSLPREQNKTVLRKALDWFFSIDSLFSKKEFHGNTKWKPEQLATEALIWAWQETKNVTDAFGQALEICKELGFKDMAKTYTAFINALDTYSDTLGSGLRQRYQALAEEVGGRFWRQGGWVLMGFDGSRATAPRTASNEKAFCAPNYGKSRKAKYRKKKKSKGMRRKQNEKNKPQPQIPQVWITLMWHMNLRLPWTWRLGPSNSSERGHVMAILQEEEFPENTLFCGDAGFVGYPLWNGILSAGGDFLIRVGANVNLLSDVVDFETEDGGLVLCWPKDKMNSGAKPLRLRLIQVKIGKTTMWLLTSVLDPKKLSRNQVIRFYKMRWGIEVEIRGLKQTLDKHKLRCRNSQRLLAELDWSIRAMAIAELFALREQIPKEDDAEDAYDPKQRSLANTMRALRQCMRTLHKFPKPGDGLLDQLSNALVQKYENHTNKQARYRPKNPDKKPLGNPNIRKLQAEEQQILQSINQNIAA